MRIPFPAVLMFPLLALADAPSADSAWQQAMVDDDAGVGEVAVLFQEAGNTIKDEYASNDVTPRLEFRCTPGDAAVTARIDWRRFISSFSTEVGFKVDGGKFTWFKWKTDSSEKITLSPSAGDTAKLVDMLRAGSRLSVEITPYSESPVEVGFDLAGFGEALLSLKEACR